MAYPEGGYWAVAPGARLRMLRALCCDALDTAIIRCALANEFQMTSCKLQRRSIITDRAGRRLALLSLLRCAQFCKAKVKEDLSIKMTGGLFSCTERRCLNAGRGLTTALTQRLLKTRRIGRRLQLPAGGL